MCGVFSDERFLVQVQCQSGYLRSGTEKADWGSS